MLPHKCWFVRKLFALGDFASKCKTIYASPLNSLCAYRVCIYVCVYQYVCASVTHPGFEICSLLCPAHVHTPTNTQQMEPWIGHFLPRGLCAPLSSPFVPFIWCYLIKICIMDKRYVNNSARATQKGSKSVIGRCHWLSRHLRGKGKGERR